MQTYEGARNFSGRVREKWADLTLSAENRTFFEEKYIYPVITDLEKIAAVQEKLTELVQKAERMGEQ